MNKSMLVRISEAEKRAIPQEQPLYVWYEVRKKRGVFYLRAEIYQSFATWKESEPIDVIDETLESAEQAVAYIRNFRTNYKLTTFSNMVGLGGDMTDDEIHTFTNIADRVRGINGHLLLGLGD